MTMRKYQERILDSSVWISATPTPVIRTLPFYVIETGHFFAESEYEIKREFHDSFLLLYTVKGAGEARLGEDSVFLDEGSAVIMDCRLPHEYKSANSDWEFMWAHISGDGVRPLYEILYPDGVIRSAGVEHRREFEDILSHVVKNASRTDIFACAEVSAALHSALSRLCTSLLSQKKARPGGEIQKAIDYIESNFSQPITVDDMVENVHLSKYHFIRRFKSVMGITPYSYLMTCRITESKSLLRETCKSVAEIAGDCGFLDTSNFIIQFRKHTGQTPAQYRRDFG